MEESNAAGTKKVLANGTRVVCTQVDMYGFNGRDMHPSRDDVGFVGVVQRNLVTRTNDEGVVVIVDNVGADTTLTDSNDEFFDVCYTVRGDDGRVLEFMDHEIERVKEMKMDTQGIKRLLAFKALIEQLDREIDKAVASNSPPEALRLERAAANIAMFQGYGVCVIENELVGEDANVERCERWHVRLRRELDDACASYISSKL